VPAWATFVAMMPVSSPRFSLVVPAFNEERYLPRLLDTLDAARAASGSGSPAVEVIVADNASTDRTAEIAATRGCRVARVEKRCIAAARNGGARIARGELLGFVDADMQVHPATFPAIEAALARPEVVGGATGVTLERWSVGLALSYAALLPLVWLTGMDTGVVFCRRADFEAVGGYDEGRRCAEDVAFLLALRRHGGRRRARLARLTAVRAIASTRKFDQHGDWHYFAAMLRLPWMLLRPSVAERWIQRYWYAPDR